MGLELRSLSQKFNFCQKLNFFSWNFGRNCGITDKMIEKETDIIVVGSGPGGATVARELARSDAGLTVTLLERGRDWRKNPLYGTYPGAMLYSDKASFLQTEEGLTVIRPLMVGGATSMYCGCAARPLPWWRDKYGIDLTQEAEETVAELNIASLPATLRGVASTRLADAGADLGMDWWPQDKFMQPKRSHNGFACGAHCMLGCRCGAKWNAAEFVDEAVQQGADLWTGARVDEILRGKRPSRWRQRAKRAHTVSDLWDGGCAGHRWHWHAAHLAA